MLGGLGLSASADGLSVVVAPGAALDAQGRMVVLADDGLGLAGDDPATRSPGDGACPGRGGCGRSS